MTVPARTRNRTIAGVAVLILLAPGMAFAQELGSAWPGLIVSELSTIYVTDDSGTETTGSLVRFEPAAVVLLVDGSERRIDAARVRRIQKRGDSLKNGALTGALIGGVLGLLSAGIADCPGARSECTAFRIAAPVVSSAFYAAVGTGIDALISGRTTLYVAPASTAINRHLLSSPGIRAGVRVTLSW